MRSGDCTTTMRSGDCTTTMRSGDCTTMMRRRDVGAAFLTLLHPFLTSGPDLGTGPDCWVFVKLLHAPHPSEEVG